MVSAIQLKTKGFAVRIPAESLKNHKLSRNMNRQKKLQQLFKAKAKKASAKLAPKKPKYISKADRLKLDAETGQEAVATSEG